VVLCYCPPLEYKNENLMIPKNTSVIIRRVPTQKPGGLAMFVQSKTGLAPNVKGSSVASSMSQAAAFNPYLDQYSHKIPPPNYVCFRCNQRGHYISDCPTADDPAYDPPRVKRATGIPKSFLKSVEPNTAGAMLGPEGNYVVFQSE
jgi:hypothetical protein